MLPNLANFSKIYLATIWYDMSQPTWLDVSMTTIFWQVCFSKFQIFWVKKIITSFFVAIFESLERFIVFLFVLNTFEPILDVFWRIWTNPEIQDGGPRWPPFRTDYAIITSCDVIASWCGRQRRHFQTYYLPSKSCCHSFYILGVTEGGPKSAPPPPTSPGRRRANKKPGLNRVRVVFHSKFWIFFFFFGEKS